MGPMIIKGLFRRYQRWNPVHPTCGAFWGMGLGIGCGVGWGPGFGPEVIGYVGAGCGIGFSVGITLAGIGVGLPANFLFQVPYNAFLTTRTGVLDVARSSVLFSSQITPGLRWNTFAPHFSVLHREATARLSIMLPLHTISIWEGVERFKRRFFHPRRGNKLISSENDDEG
ncbi:cadmium-induced protein AS8 isoform X3 [Durio zibethinus]|uniref:Cadmium-induced protein AS8 isoform X3 n=1 Tax=Durio zibethinus TaxID=66656 RepID=A0A6P5XCW7_DURZI|nr:cadmium-induced protein AS8 isoform X3 [Durio zibethinus]